MFSKELTLFSNLENGFLDNHLHYQVFDSVGSCVALRGLFMDAIFQILSMCPIFLEHLNVSTLPSEPCYRLAFPSDMRPSD